MKGVYKIINKINNKIYIGESLDINRRWQEHVIDLNNSMHHSNKLQDDWNTYRQDNFIFEIEEDLDYLKYTKYVEKSVLIVKENEYINKYNSIENGYNIENTLKKILNGEQGILDGERINKNQKFIIKSVIKNIEENNGVYIIKNNKINKKKNDTANIKKEKKMKKEKSPYKTIKTLQEIDNKNRIITDENNNIIKRMISVLIHEFSSDKEYLFLYSGNKIFEILRDKNILYYNEDKINVPYDAYIKQGYFEIKENEYGEIKNITTFVTNKGKEFIKNLLLEENFMVNKKSNSI